jgi:hypothetical protein
MTRAEKAITAASGAMVIAKCPYKIMPSLFSRGGGLRHTAPRLAEDTCWQMPWELSGCYRPMPKVHLQSSSGSE